MVVPEFLTIRRKLQEQAFECLCASGIGGSQPPFPIRFGQDWFDCPKVLISSDLLWVPWMEEQV
jgi:hypothetical protein